MIGGGMSHRGMFRRKQGSSPVAPYFTFKTKFNGEVSFEITKSGTPATWYMGDGTVYTATNSVTHTYADGSEKTVSVAVDNFANITGLGTFTNKEITYFDASKLSHISGALSFNTNPDLTSFLFPENNNTFGISNLNFTNTNLTGVADLTGILSFSANPIFNIINNSNLTGILFATGITSPFRGDLRNNNLTGAFDLSGFSSLSFLLNLGGNSNLTDITFPSGGGSGLQLFAVNCNLTGTLDCTNYTGTYQNVDLSNNPNLTSILINNSENSRIKIENCNLTGVLDLSNFGVSVWATFKNNPNLTGFLAKSSNSNITNPPGIDFTGCNLTGNLDLSTIPLRTIINLSGNTLLTSLNCPPAVGRVNSANFSNCNLGVSNFQVTASPGLESGNNDGFLLANNNMTAAEVNEILVNLDAALGIISPASPTINIDGTNAAPDSSSGGFDGLAAKSSLTSKGYIVLTN